MSVGMTRTQVRIATRVACSGALAAALASASASAAELSREKLEKSTDIQNCAVHGPGYVKVEGSDACARIGSRLRVEMNINRAPRFVGGFPQPFESGLGFDEPPGGDGPARAHLRLDQPSGRATDRQITR